jgi:hypothetical protein
MTRTSTSNRKDGSSPQTDDARGFAFPEALHEVVCKSGPSDLSQGEQQALSEYLLTAAMEWVRARNRISRALKQ